MTLPLGEPDVGPNGHRLGLKATGITSVLVGASVSQLEENVATSLVWSSPEELAETMLSQPAMAQVPPIGKRARAG